VDFPNAPSPVHAILARQPRGVVAELPVPRADRLPGPDPGYAYMSSFHWFPMVNGYSGNYPPSYFRRIDRLLRFPDDRSLAQLRADRVRYVIVHTAGYSAEAMSEILQKLIGAGMSVLGRFPADDGPAWLFVAAGA